MAKLVSTTYGEALYELGVEENILDQLWEEAGVVKSVVESNKEFAEVMSHPKVTLEERISLLDNIWKDRISNEMLGFLKLLVEKERYSELTSILGYFLGKVKELKGIGVAYVTSAFEMSDVQKSAVKDKLLGTTRYNTMEMHFDVDSSLIGGMIIRIGDRVVDSSVRTKLGALEKQLLQIQV